MTSTEYLAQLSAQNTGTNVCMASSLNETDSSRKMDGFNFEHTQN